MPPKNRKKSPAIQKPEDSESSEFVDAPDTTHGPTNQRTTRANPQGLTNTNLENEPAMTSSADNFTRNDSSSRSVSPSTSSQRSKSANSKRVSKNKQNSDEVFQAPLGAPPANRRSSTTVLGTPRSQRTINDYVPTVSGTHIPRKDSYENQGIQIQLINRQTEEVKTLIENNNIEMEERICRTINGGENSILSRLEEILIARDKALEERLTHQILEGDRKITSHLNDRIYETERNLERKIGSSILETQGKLKQDLSRNINDSITRLSSRIDDMEDSSQASASSLGSRISVLSQKQDSQHSDLLQGLSQIDEIKNKLSTNSRKIEEINYSMEDRMIGLKNDLRAQRIQTEEKLNAVNEGLNGLEMFKESVIGVKTRCNELSTNFNNMTIKLTQYETDRLAHQEQLSSFQAQLDRHEASINTLNTKTENSDGTNRYAHQIEHRNHNVLLSSLPPEFHSVEGLRRFSRNYLQHEIRENELKEVFKIGESNRSPIVKARFSTLDARTRFYKARTRLGPNNDIWMNDDLTKQQESLAHQARQLYQNGKIFRTWTYLNSVFIQLLPTDSPLKVTDSRSLNTGAADSMGNILQLFTLVPSRNRTFLPGMNPNVMDVPSQARYQVQGSINQRQPGNMITQPQTRQQSQYQGIQSIPDGQYQPLIPLTTMEDGFRNRQCSGQIQPRTSPTLMDGH